MSVSNGIVSAPVSIKDIQSLLGESSGDLATLCKSGNIKIWAKYKPTKKNAAFTDDWWKGEDFNAGISIPSTVQVEKVIDFYSQTNNGWSYQRPTGGASSPYRLGDFRGYNHNATSPLGQMNKLPEQRAANSSIGVTFIFSVNRGTDELDLSSISSITNCYFGCIMMDSNNSFYAIKTVGTMIKDMEAQLGEGAFGITLKWDSGQFAIGTYKIVPVLSSRAYTSMVGNSGLGASVNYYPMPTGEVQIVKIVSASSALTDYVEMVGDRTGTSIKVTIKVDANGSTYTNVVVYISTTTDASGSVATWNVGTISKGNTYAKTLTVPSATARYRLLLYSGGTLYITKLLRETATDE